MQSTTNAATLPLVNEHEGELDLEAIGPRLRDRRMALGYTTYSRAADEYSAAIGDTIYRAAISKAESGEASTRTVRLILLALDRLEERERVSRQAPPPEGATGAMTVALHGVYGIDDVKMTFDGNTPPDVMETYVRALLSGVKSSAENTGPQGSSAEDQT